MHGIILTINRFVKLNLFCLFEVFLVCCEDNLQISDTQKHGTVSDIVCDVMPCFIAIAYICNKKTSSDLPLYIN